MTATEYIKSLTDEEKNYALEQFYEWVADDCPAIAYEKYGYKCNFECRDKYDQLNQADGCWLKFYVWKFRQEQDENGEWKNVVH